MYACFFMGGSVVEWSTWNLKGPLVRASPEPLYPLVCTNDTREKFRLNWSFVDWNVKHSLKFHLDFSALCAVDCNVEGDGTYELGCKAYVICDNGVGTQNECKEKTVYNNATKTCDL